MECYERTCCVIGLGYLDCRNGACQGVLEYIFCSSHLWFLERIFGGRKTNADGGVAMKTPEDEAFEDIERRQGGGFSAKRAMAADKFIAAEERKVGERYGYVPKLHPSEWMDESAQEPVAWTLLLTDEHHGIIGKAGEKFIGAPECYQRVNVYTTPPKRPWVGLTLDEIEELFQIAAGADEETDIRFARLIEAKLKEKNT